MRLWSFLVSYWWLPFVATVAIATLLMKVFDLPNGCNTTGVDFLGMLGAFSLLLTGILCFQHFGITITIPPHF